MAEPEVPSQPSQAADILGKVFAPESIPQAEAAAEDEGFDTATITIPDQKFAAGVPKSLEKVRGKTLTAVGELIEQTDRWGHENAQKAAQAQRENEDLRSRLAAAEQYARMNAQPQTPQPIYDPYQGINTDEAIITAPRQVLDRTLTEADRRAAEIAQRTVNAAIQADRNERNQVTAATELVTAFEMARGQVSKMVGREITTDEWRDELQDVARIVKEREPGRMFDHNVYAETYARLKGVPKATIPTEGNPGLSSRPSTANARVQTTTSENADLRAAIGRALGKEKLGDKYKNWVK